MYDFYAFIINLSFSEAVCETVGSVMNQHSGRNRHLQPTYFSIEIHLWWNLGPLHFLKNLIEDVYNREKKIIEERPQELIK